MKEVKLPHVNDVAMFKDKPFHPITKNPIVKSAKLDCSMERKYGTGMIICKEKKKVSSLAFTAIGTLALIVFSVFIFSIQFEFKHLDDFPFLVVLLSNIHYVLLAVAVLGIVLVLIFKQRK